MAKDEKSNNSPVTNSATASASSKDIGNNQNASQQKTQSMKKGILPEGIGSGVGLTGKANTNGTFGMTVGTDIMTGATFRKYNHTEKLEGVQLQYANSPKQLKVVNFKQDYVVLIRKKLFYAANAQGQIDKENATLDDGNYVRSYKLDTFTSIRTNISIAGTPGTCQIELQGAERVYCFEENSRTPKGVPLLKGMVSDEWPDNYAQIAYDSNNSMGARGVGTGGKKSSIYDDEDFKGEGNGSIWNRNNASSVEANGVKAEIHTRYQKYATENGESYGVLGKVRVYQNNIDDEFYRNATPAQREILKKDENGKYYYEGLLPARSNENENELPEIPSGWKIVEKCDFEPMDEVWVFGKSNFERDPSTGDFAMKQIFFGYIDTVTKQHSSGKTAGCTVSISATDQLKMLDLSYVTMNPSMTPGASGRDGLDLRFSAQDKAHFGTFEVFNPYEVANLLGEHGCAEDATEAQKETIRAAWRYLSLTNCFAGRPVCDIIRQLCLDAGIPTWYLKDRIEPIQWPPFVYQLKQANSSTLFNGVMMKRLQQCVAAAQKLMLEFFADEEGNIVLKVPNYILGANSLEKNNMGFSQLNGGLLGKITIDDIQPYYSSLTIDYKREQAQQQTMNQADEEAQNTASHINDDLSPEAKQFYYQQMAEKTLLVNGGNATTAANILSGATETNNAAAYISAYRTYNPAWNPTSQPQVAYTFKEGDTFWNVSEKHLNTGKYYPQILQDVHEQIDSSIGENDCEKVWGKTIILHLNKYWNQLNSDNKSVAHETTEQMYNKFKSGDYQVWQKDNNITNKRKTQKQYEAEIHKRYDQSLSEMSDALIPEIPQEYIISFNLVDTDKQLYNMYEINIEGDFGVFDKGGAIQKISRVYPDLASMIRFGCRPAPQVYSFPYMGNRENAHLLGFMMTAQSVARRHSATLSMIEDSSIKVGNPIRFFAYDEHPDLPIAEQGNHMVGNTAYTATGANGNTATLEQNQMAQLYQQQQEYLKQGGIKETETGKPIKFLKNPADNTVGTAPIEVPHSCFPDVNTTPNKKNKQESNEKGTVPTEAKPSEQITDGSVTEETIPAGKVVNHSAGVGKPSSFEGVSASVIASQTDAQSIYYVEQVSRNIGVSKESTMTLTLTCGRMMGKPSLMDYMMLLYKCYYDPSLGYVADLKTLAKYQEKYKGKLKEHKITNADTLTAVAHKEYPNIFTFEVPHNPKIEQTEDANQDPYLLSNIVAGNSSYSATDEEKKLFQDAIANGWKKLTSKIKGKYYRVNSDDPTRGSVLFEYTYYIYDYSRQRWSFLRTGDDGNGGSSNTTKPVDNQEVKSDPNKKDKNSAEGKSGGTTETTSGGNNKPNQTPTQDTLNNAYLLRKVASEQIQKQYKNAHNGQNTTEPKALEWARETNNPFYTDYSNAQGNIKNIKKQMAAEAQKKS